MSCRKRPASALSALPRIDDVRNHVDVVRGIMNDFPDWSYRRVGARLCEVLEVSLEESDYQAVQRLQKAEPNASDADRHGWSHFFGNVRDHVDSIQELVVSHPELQYKAIGRKLEQRLGVKLSCAHLQAVRRIMAELSNDVVALEWEEFSGDMRDHVDSIRALVVAHPGMGYKGTAKELEQHIRLKLSPAHLSVVRRIVEGISQGRAVLGAQREPENCEAVPLDVRDHAATIMELMTRHPAMDYHGIAHELQKVLGVELCESQKQCIPAVMAEISIDLVAEDVAMPEQTDVDDIFSGDVREHEEVIKELVASHPELRCTSIGRKLEQRLAVKLSCAHLQVVRRIMMELAEGRAAEAPRQEWDDFSGDMRAHVDSIRALVVAHPGMGYKGIAKEFERHIRFKLSHAHLSVVRRIVGGISQGRAVPGAQREPEDCAAGVDMRDHIATIEELMMQDPSMDYQGVAHQLEEKLQVELSDAQKQAIRGVMAQIGIQLVAADMAMPEQTDLEIFSGDVREHVDAIQELVTSHPGLGYRAIGRKLAEQLGVKLCWAHVLVVERVMRELSEGRAAVGVSMRQQPERQNFLHFVGNLRQHVDDIKELMALHPKAGRHHISRQLEIRLGQVLSARHESVIRRIMIQHGSLSYELLCSDQEAPVVQRLLQDLAEPAARRKAVQDHYERGVSWAVLRRWTSEHYAPDAGERPVRRVWKDKYVDCAATCWARRVRAKTDEDKALQAVIKSVHREAVPLWMLGEARHRAATIRRWDAVRRREFSAVCHGALPCRTALPSGRRGAALLQGYRFFIAYENWISCQQCGYRWQVHKGQLSGERLVYGDTLRSDRVSRLPRVLACGDRGKDTRCPLPLEALLWPLPAEIEVGVETEQLYLVPQENHWPVYLPGLQRFVTAYDLGPRLAAMRQAMREGPVGPMDVDELETLVQEYAIYGDFVREHGAQGIVSLLDITKEEAATITPFLLFVTKQKERGSVTRGPTYNWKKTQVCRVNYKREDLDTCGAMTPRARAAYNWLMLHNRTYRRYVMQHKRELAAPAEYREMFIATYRLLIQSRGIEAALYPVPYPWEVYGDSDVSSWAKDRQLVKKSQLPTIKHSFLRKVHSRCRTYGDAEAVPDLAFLLYDMVTAQRISASIAIAERQGITPDVVADNSSTSESYWRHEQLRGQRRAFPNLFITIAPAEWKVLLHEPLFADWKAADRMSACQGMLSEHIYDQLYDGMKQILRPNEFFEEVFDYVIRLEFQGRKTEHIHIAAWARPKGNLSGRSGQADRSAFVMFLEEVFRGSVDVQEGHGFLKHINGYVVKGNQSMDYQPDAARSAGDEHSAWRTTYRMLCKLAPGLPEVFLDFAGAKHMYRTFGVVNAYAIIPGQLDKGNNDTKRLYKKYLLREPVGDGPKPCGSFLSYLRTYKLSEDHEKVIERRGRGGDSRVAVGARFAFEMQDPQLIPFTAHYLKAVKYLQHLVCMTGTRPSCEECIRQRVKEMMPQEEGEAEEHYRLRVLAKMKSTRWVGFARNATSIVELLDAPVETIADRLHEHSWEPYDGWPWPPPSRSDDSEDMPMRPGDQLFHPLRCADDTEGAYGKPFHGVDAALAYFEDVVAADLRIRVSPGRARSFRARLHAVHCYYSHMQRCRDHPEAIPLDVRRKADRLMEADSSIDAQFAYYNEYKRQWNKCDAHARPRLTWSADQEEVLK
ncbi:unnamed protein product, partial [Prorocentrum cordatum]